MISFTFKCTAVIFEPESHSQTIFLSDSGCCLSLSGSLFEKKFSDVFSGCLSDILNLKFHSRFIPVIHPKVKSTFTEFRWSWRGLQCASFWCLSWHLLQHLKCSSSPGVSLGLNLEPGENWNMSCFPYITFPYLEVSRNLLLHISFILIVSEISVDSQLSVYLLWR